MIYTEEQWAEILESLTEGHIRFVNSVPPVGLPPNLNDLRGARLTRDENRIHLTLAGGTRINITVTLED